MEVGLKSLPDTFYNLFAGYQGIPVTYSRADSSDPFLDDFRSVVLKEIRKIEFYHSPALVKRPSLSVPNEEKSANRGVGRRAKGDFKQYPDLI
jgi:hypothetical protein